MNISRELLIEIAEDCRLLIPEPQSSQSYQSPAHQRFISRLENFAKRIERELQEEALQKVSDLSKDIGQEL